MLFGLLKNIAIRLRLAVVHERNRTIFLLLLRIGLRLLRFNN